MFFFCGERSGGQAELWRIIYILLPPSRTYYITRSRSRTSVSTRRTARSGTACPKGLKSTAANPSAVYLQKRPPTTTTINRQVRTHGKNSLVIIVNIIVFLIVVAAYQCNAWRDVNPSDRFRFERHFGHHIIRPILCGCKLHRAVLRLSNCIGFRPCHSDIYCIIT